MGLLVGLRVPRSATRFEVIAHPMYAGPVLATPPGATDTLRVWVPGCSTGEEVYSIAILMREHLDTLRRPPKLQIFATDIDEGSLAVARYGT
jgi:two-component system CheB/CheR fusion protein